MAILSIVDYVSQQPNPQFQNNLSQSIQANVLMSMPFCQEEFVFACPDITFWLEYAKPALLTLSLTLLWASAELLAMLTNLIILLLLNATVPQHISA